MNGMRDQGWPEALAEYVDSRRDAPFAWGTNDCTSWAAGAIEAMTGERPPIPAYANEFEAARLLREESLRSRVDELYGPEIAPAFARRGDLVLILVDGRETLGVCVGDHIAGPGRDGVVMVHRSAAIAAWRI